jgi:DNA invertase Pin-like site-specific DNA recombinase
VKTAKTPAIPPSAVAYSYIRFSHPDQAKGDSLRRQTEAAEAWCEKNHVRLDSSTTLHDLGKSAYTGAHRTNPDRHALAAFLKLVEAGKVPRGSYLVVENLDRLSREDIQPALLLVLNLMQAGVRIVQLKPAEMVFDDKSDTMPVMMMMIELSRGHGESAIKSERVGAAWAERKRKARENGEVLTRRVPAWVEERSGKLVLVPERADAVRRIFALAASGYGHASIVRRLTEDKVPAFGSSGRWTRPYVAKILTGRVALGECQVRAGRDRHPDGDPIPGYFPPVVTEAVWLAARAGAAERLQKRGRVGRRINPFAGLLRNAREGDTYFVTDKGQGPVLINTASCDGAAPSVTFPYQTFERAILLMLREIDPQDILNGDHAPDESQVLAGKLVHVEASIAAIEADLDAHGDSPELLQRLRARGEQKRALAQKLADAKQRAANPLSSAWGECQSLAAVLDAAPDPDDTRRRLRSLLRRMIDSIWLWVAKRGRDRLCAAQIWFAGLKKHRDYLILHRPPLCNGKMPRREGGWWARSLASSADPGDLDLRKPDHAKRLATALEQIDLDAIIGETPEE